jgi:hypothetical protein
MGKDSPEIWAVPFLLLHLQKHKYMKKLIILSAIFLLGCTAQSVTIGKIRKDYSKFSIDGQLVLYGGKPLAKYQAKTYSLDNGELVEEYNLLLLDNNLTNKQLIGDLIDFVSERHEGAEVEVEIDSYQSSFKL